MFLFRNARYSFKLSNFFSLSENTKDIDLPFLIHFGSVFFVWISILYIVHGFTKTSVIDCYSNFTKYGDDYKKWNSLLFDQTFSKIMRFLDYIGLEGLKTKKNQKLIEVWDKRCGKNCARYFFYLFLSWLSGFFVSLIPLKIKKCWIKLFIRETRIAKNVKIALSRIVNNRFIYEGSGKYWDLKFRNV